MDDIARPEEGHCLGQDGLVHVFVKGRLLCDKSYFPVLITEEHHIVTDHANCPVCVIAARKRIEDLINPPEKQPEEDFTAAVNAAILAQLGHLQNSAFARQQSINMGNVVTNRSVMVQQQRQQFNQQKMIFDSGLLSQFSNLFPLKP